MSQRDVQQLVRIFTMSVGDWLDSLFENDYLKGSIASTGVVGVWAGPYSPRHRLQPAPPRARRARRQRRLLGPGDRRDGRDQRGDRLLRPRRRRRDPDRAPRSPASTPPAGASPASRSPTAPSSARRSSPPAPTRRRRSWTSPAAENFPDEVGEDMAAYRTRGASVKINMVLSRGPGLRGPERGGVQAPADRRRQLLPLARLPRAGLAGRRPRRPGREARTSRWRSRARSTRR